MVDITATSSPLRGYVSLPGNGVSVDPTMKASRDATGGALSVFETTVDDGPPLHVHTHDDGPPLHVHTHEDESIYVLEGEVSVRCGEETLQAPAGSFVFLPRGTAHCFWSAGAPARVLLMAVPGGIEDYFAEINAATTDEERGRIGERYGIRVILDPG
ncbi:MAG TPA: cupin domain-containing protein [Candidatus Dormibacteraeota bacterium]|nr:cupin domain-containing protein [Candidatus Dormibacteraeota bacterium]